MNFSKFQFTQWLILTTFVIAVPACIVPVRTASAQKTADSVLTEQEELHKKLVFQIYESTKTARTAKDFSGIIELCETTLTEQNLSEKHRDYVTSLNGWAKCHRGQERFELALSLEKVGNKQAAVVKQGAMKDFDESVKADPKRYRSWMARGIAFSICGEHKKAARDFTAVVKLKTDYANAWFNRAETLYELKKFELAIKDYDVAIRLNSDDAQALTGRAHCHLALKNLEEALADYNRVVELQPENHIAFLNRGDAYSDQCEWQLSLADYEQSCFARRTAEALQRMSWLKATCSDTNVYDPKDALSLAKQAIDLGGKSAECLDTLAAAQAANGNFTEAKSTQTNAIQLVGAESDILAPLKSRLALYEDNQSFKQNNK